MNPVDPLGIVSLLLSAWSLKSDASTGDLIRSSESRLRRYIRRQMGQHTEALDAILAISDKVDLVLEAIEASGIAGPQRLPERTREVLLDETRVQVQNLLQATRSGGFANAPQEARDAALTIALATHASRAHMYCLRTLPIQRLFVSPSIYNTIDESSSKHLGDFDIPQCDGVVIAGQYGRGKSTLLKMLSTYFVDPNWFTAKDSFAIPVYITASDMARAWPKCKTVIEAMATAFKDRHGVGDLDVFELAAGAGTILFMVDGWDEIHSADVASELFRECIDSATNYRRLGLFVFGGRSRFFTTRSSRGALKSKAVAWLECRGFELEDQKRWLEKWSGLCVESGLVVPPKDLLRNQDRRYRDILHNPLILLLVALRHSFGSAQQSVGGPQRIEAAADVLKWVVDVTVSGKPIIPTEIGGQYRGAVDLDTKVPVLPDCDEEKRRLLQETAYVAHTSGGKTARRADLERHLPEYCSEDYGLVVGKLEASGDSLSDWYSTLALTHFFEQNDDEVEFAHQAFIDYLVAELYARLDPESLRSARRPLSTDQAYLAFQIAGEREDVLTQIAEMAFGGLDAALLSSSDADLVLMIGEHIGNDSLLAFLEWVRDWCVGDDARDRVRGEGVLGDVMEATLYEGRFIEELQIGHQEIAWFGDRGFGGLLMADCTVIDANMSPSRRADDSLPLSGSQWTDCRFLRSHLYVSARGVTVLRGEFISSVMFADDDGTIECVAVLFQNRCVIQGAFSKLVFKKCRFGTPVVIRVNDRKNLEIEAVECGLTSEVIGVIMERDTVIEEVKSNGWIVPVR